MRDFIFPPKTLFGVSIAITLFAIFQVGIAGTVQTLTKVSEGPCTFQSWSQGRSAVRLNLDCEGTATWTEDAHVILGYLEKPGPFNCSVMKSGKAFCELTKKLVRKLTRPFFNKM
jgi:hypothetical protein